MKAKLKLVIITNETLHANMVCVCVCENKTQVGFLDTMTVLSILGPPKRPSTGDAVVGTMLIFPTTSP